MLKQAKQLRKPLKSEDVIMVNALAAARVALVMAASSVVFVLYNVVKFFKRK